MDDGASGQNPDFNRRARLARVRSWYALTAVPRPNATQHAPPKPGKAREEGPRPEIAGATPSSGASARCAAAVASGVNPPSAPVGERRQLGPAPQAPSPRTRLETASPQQKNFPSRRREFNNGCQTATP